MAVEEDGILPRSPCRLKGAGRRPPLPPGWLVLQAKAAAAQVEASSAAEHPHPDVMPFIVPWTDQQPAEIARGVIQHHWLRLGNWPLQDWSLNLTVFHSGDVVGRQTISARDLAVRRQVHTGSWLGQRYQRQGIGTEMRAAVLHLAFTGLGADEAVSGAFEDNPASEARAAPTHAC